MLEVALRNVADRQLTAKRGANWMDDAQTLRMPYQQNCATAARQQLLRDRKPATHGQMVAELNFGFWGRSLAGRAITSGATSGQSFRPKAFSGTASPSRFPIFALSEIALPTTMRF
jgi:hypothetical protein